ncbi:MAG: isocitrate/isopropylmalate dehydrogenase family protein [Candidatus Bathyarchaeia archaeon]
MSKLYRIAVLPGDGIGPEVTNAALLVLDALQDSIKGLRLKCIKGEAGYNCIEKYGTNLPAETIEILKNSDACLKGPMTTPEEPGSPVSVAVTIRKMFDLYANVRPCKSLPGIPSLKPNIDLIILRENTEGLYSGKELEIFPGVGIAFRVITRKACERIARFAFKLALERKKHVTYVHKANILKLTDGIFKQAILDISKEFPDISIEDVHIDAMAMRLIKMPEAFDTIVTTNLFGDILSDEAAQVVGGLGLVAGANIGDNYGMFEPVHGSAPKYAGKDKVNPIAMIFAAKMMMEYFKEKEAAEKIEKAVFKVLEEGKVKTYDLGGNAKCSEMAKEIAKKILEQS